MQEGRAGRIVIRTKKILPRRKMRPCYRPGCIGAVVSSSSSSSLSLFPHLCHCRHVCYFSPSSLAFLLPREKLLAMAVGGLVVVVVLVVVIPDNIGLFDMDNNDEYPPDTWGKGSDVAEGSEKSAGLNLNRRMKSNKKNSTQKWNENWAVHKNGPYSHPPSNVTPPLSVTLF